MIFLVCLVHFSYCAFIFSLLIEISLPLFRVNIFPVLQISANCLFPYSSPHKVKSRRYNYVINIEQIILSAYYLHFNLSLLEVWKTSK